MHQRGSGEWEPDPSGSHHLLKTFYVGPNGWADRQLSDGAVIWTSPTGHTYATKPGGRLYFPALAQPTGDLTVATGIVVPHPKRGVMMPKRQCTRSEDVTRRVADERRRNGECLVREQRLLADSLARDYQPPPF